VEQDNKAELRRKATVSDKIGVYDDVEELVRD
jgi:hypothetical protein